MRTYCYLRENVHHFINIVFESKKKKIVRLISLRI